MTDQADGTGFKEPPKIKLGFTDEPDTSAPKAGQPAAQTPPAAPPPKLKLRGPGEAGEKKAETAPVPPVQSAEPKPATAAQPAPAEAQAEKPVAEKPIVTAPKGQTIRLDDIEEESLDDLYKAALNATQRVILDEQRSGDTGKIPPVDESQVLKKAEIAESSKKATARLDLQELLSEDERKDLQPKHETLHIGEDGAPKAKPTGTLKIQKPTEEEQQASITMPIALDLEESKKSETARIDLPREVVSQTPPTQRKTIRIKRPDAGGATGGTRPALSIARPAATEKKAAATAQPGALKLDSDEDTVHPAFSAVALVAVLVSIAVVYVLAATVSPSLPFPGRLL